MSHDFFYTFLNNHFENFRLNQFNNELGIALIFGSKLLTNRKNTLLSSKGVIITPTVWTSHLTTFFLGSGMDIPLKVFPFMLRPTPIYDFHYVSKALTAVQYKTLSRFFTNGIGILYKFCITLLVLDMVWIVYDYFTSDYQVEYKSVS